MSENQTTTEAVAKTAPPKPRIRTSHLRLMHFQEQLKDKLCYAYYQPGKTYCKHPLGSGHTYGLEEAARMKVSTFIEHYSRSIDWMCELVDQTFAEKIEQERVQSCNFSRSMPVAASMIKAAPMNPSYRAIVSARVKQPVPEELKTWEEIEDWVNHTHVDLVSLKTIEEIESESEHAASQPFGPRPVADPPIEPFATAMSITGREVGHCRYACYCRGSHTWEFPVRRLLAEARGAESLDRLMEWMQESYRDDCPEDSHGFDDNQDYDYQDLEMEEVCDVRHWFRNRDQTLEELKVWLRWHLETEHLARLGITS